MGAEFPFPVFRYLLLLPFPVPAVSFLPDPWRKRKEKRYLGNADGSRFLPWRVSSRYKIGLKQCFDRDVNQLIKSNRENLFLMGYVVENVSGMSISF